MRAADSSAKALIFSSFQPTVDCLKQILPGWGYGFRFINGERGGQLAHNAILLAQHPSPAVLIAPLSRQPL